MIYAALASALVIGFIFGRLSMALNLSSLDFAAARIEEAAERAVAFIHQPPPDDDQAAVDALAERVDAAAASIEAALPAE